MLTYVLWIVSLFVQLCSDPHGAPDLHGVGIGNPKLAEWICGMERDGAPQVRPQTDGRSNCPSR